MAADDEYEGGPDRLEEKMADLDEELAESRAEALDEPGAFDNLTARAMDTLAGIIAVGGHLLRPSGHLLAMKGVYPHEEIAALPAGWQMSEVRPLQVPGLTGERHLVVCSRS